MNDERQFNPRPGTGESAQQIHERLLKDRIIFLGGMIDDKSAQITIASMLFLQLTDANKPISLYVKSPGGSVNASLAIFDTMNQIKNAVHTYCIGNADSMAAILVAHGSKGNRYTLPNAIFSVGECSGGSDNEKAGHFNNLLSGFFAADTGQFVEQVRADFKANRFFSAVQALEYGIVDEILK